jgi:hypothetical protein
VFSGVNGASFGLEKNGNSLFHAERDVPSIVIEKVLRLNVEQTLVVNGVHQ